MRFMTFEEAVAEFLSDAGGCPHGDPTCPCPDGLLCHYEDPDPMRCPTTRLVGGCGCRARAEAMKKEDTR